MSRTGLPNPASLLETVENLFQNEKYVERDDTDVVVSFSKLVLTPEQKAQLVYPSGLIPIDFYIFYQTDRFQNGELIRTSMEVVSFAQRRDFIYGVYFDVQAQARFEIDQLVESEELITLSATARIITDFYIEVYNEIKGLIVILGLSTLAPEPLASLQYSRKCKYFYEAIYDNGIRGEDQFIPVTHLTGLSANLRMC
ncbi:Hypothetical protein HVR_LOCUS764 [uncultured virus]|nr:Hypothetical protein HVR_LOCUS764 [uncultured virus]